MKKIVLLWLMMVSLPLAGISQGYVDDLYYVPDEQQRPAGRTGRRPPEDCGRGEGQRCRRFFQRPDLFAVVGQIARQQYRVAVPRADQMKGRVHNRAAFRQAFLVGGAAFFIRGTLGTQGGRIIVHICH